MVKFFARARNTGAIMLAVLFSTGFLATGYVAGDEYRIYWSSDGKLDPESNSDVRYSGCSPVTAMVAYKDGVLTAFTNVDCKGKDRNRIHWSSDGNNLGGGPIHYDGCSPVTTMTPYKSGVLSGFTNVECKGREHNRIHWSPDGKDLGKHSPTTTWYSGVCEIQAILPYKGGVLVAVKYTRQYPEWCVYYKDPSGGRFGDPLTVRAPSQEAAKQSGPARRRLRFYNDTSVVGKISISGVNPGPCR